MRWIGLMLALSGCSLLVVKPVPSDWTATSRRAPSCDDGAKLANAVDLAFALSGLSSVGYGIDLAKDDHVGTGILIAGIGVVVTAFFAHTADIGDDRAADCRAAILDYNYETSKALRTLHPEPRGTRLRAEPVDHDRPEKTPESGTPDDAEPTDESTE